MGVQNLFRRGGNLGWLPDADSVNAPEGALLRADNIILDELGALALRKGSSKIYDSMADADIHTINTFLLTGFDESAEGTYRLSGQGSKLYKNGVDTGVEFDGSGDFAMGSDSYQAFIARGTTKKKFDGMSVRNWGIAAPSTAPSLEGSTAVSVTVASFNTAESPAFVVNEGTSTFATGYDATASGSMELTPDRGTGRASISKKFASDQDFFSIAGSDGADTDLFDIYVWLEEPKKVDTITIMFGMGTGDDAYRDDYYYFDFNIRNPDTVNVKDAGAYTAASYKKTVDRMQSVLSPDDITKVKTTRQVTEVLNRLGRFAGPRSRERKDSQEASPAWAHLSVTRGQFNRVGGTANRDWSTIRAFKVVYTSTPGNTKKVRFDSAVLFGGGERALTGKFRCGYRFVRDTGTYYELSPISPISDDIVLTQQALEVTIPAAAISGADSQVNQIWVYLFGGFLDTFYRVAVTGSTANNSSMRIDEFSTTADGAIDASDRTRLVNQGLSIPGFSANNDMVLTIFKSELDALIENEALEPGCVGPPDNIVAIEGPYASRTFALTDEGWLFPSSQRSPSTFSVYHAIDLRRWGTPLWMRRTNGGIYVGMTADVIRISGSGDESPDRTIVDLYAEPLHVAHPPIEETAHTDGNNIVYLSADGLMNLNGVALVPVSQAQTSLLWRGYTRHGIQPLNLTTGRFRLATDNQALYMLAPEGDSTTSTNVIWRYMQSKWARLVYGADFRSIYQEPDGTLVAGDTEGNLWKLNDGFQDEGENIEVTILTPIDDGGDPLRRKDPFDFQLHMDTSGDTATITVYKDGSDDEVAEYEASTSTASVYRINVSEVADDPIGTFLRLQLKLTGEFFHFVLQVFNVSYRSRPQMMMAVDTDAIIPPVRFDWLRWIEVDCYSPVDLTMTVFMDDVQVHEATVPVVANKRGNYIVSLPKGIKGSRPRILLTTTSDDGSGAVGFEPYMIKAKFDTSGSETDLESVIVWSA